jgi:transposase
MVPLSCNSPELNPVEHVWLHLKRRYLAHFLLANFKAIAEAATQAWNSLRAETGRITSLCTFPWIPKVN